MANPFDQFDAPATSNPFDAFDDPSFKPPKPSGLLRRGIGDTAVSLGKGVIGLGEGAVGLSSLATGGLAGQLAEQAGFRPKEAKAMLDEFYSPEQQAANRAVSDAKGFGGTLSSILQNPSVVPQMVAESLPSMIGGQAIAKGALKAAGLAGEAITPTAARWAGAGGEGAITAGGVAEQIRQEAPDGNIYAAVPAGVATGLIGVAGGKLANRMGLGDVDTALLTAANRGTASLPKRILGGVASEGLLEEMPQSMQEQFFQNLGTGKPLGEGVAEAGASGLVTGGAMGGAFGILHKPAGPLSRAADTSIQSGAAQEQQRVAAEHAAQAIGQPPSSAQAVSRGDSAPSTEEFPVRTTSSDADQQNSSSSPMGLPQYNGPTQYVHPDGSVSTDPQAIRSAIEAERMASLAPQPYDAPLEEAKATRREQMARAQERAKPMPTTNVAAAQQKAAALTEQTGIPHSVVPTGNEIGGKPLVIVQPEQANGAIPGTTPAEVVLQGADAQGLEPARSAGDVERNAAVGGNDGADAGAAALGVRPDTAVRDVAGGERVDAPLYPTPKRSDSPSWVIRNKETGEVQFETFDRKKVDALNTAKYEAVPILHYLQEINRKVANAPQAQGARPAGVEAQPVLRGIPGETAAQRPDAGQDATAQGASVPNAAQAPDVAGKTPDQLAYLATNGKPGWKEAAQAEIARRSQADTVPQSGGYPTGDAPQQTLDRAAAEARYKEILRQYGSKTVGKMWKPSTPLEIKTEAEQLRNILAPQQGQTNARVGSGLAGTIPAGEAVDAAPPKQVVGEAQAPAGAEGKTIPRGQARSLIELIRRNGGIHTRLQSDIAGDKAVGKRGFPVGVFRSNGLGEDRLAELLQQHGYLSEADVNSAEDTSGAGKAMDMVRRALNGERVLSIQDQEAERSAAEEQAYRARIRSQAKEFGIHTVGRKFSDFEEAVLRAQQDKQDRETAALESDERAAYDGLLDDLRADGILNDEDIADLVERHQNAPLRELMTLLEAAHQDKLAAINTDLAAARTTPELNEDDYRDAYQRENAESYGQADAAAAGEGKATGRQADDAGQAQPGFSLQSQTENELRAREEGLARQQQQEAEAQRQADEKARAARVKEEVRQRSEAAASTFELGGDALQNLSGQGGLFDQPAQTKPVNEKAAPSVNPAFNAGPRGGETLERPEVRADKSGSPAEPAQIGGDGGGDSYAATIPEKVQAEALKAAQKEQDALNQYDLAEEVQSVANNGMVDLSALAANPDYWDAENEEFTPDGQTEVDRLIEQRARENLNLPVFDTLSDLDGAHRFAQVAAMEKILDGLGIGYDRNYSFSSSRYITVNRVDGTTGLKLRFADHLNTAKGQPAPDINVAPGGESFSDALRGIVATTNAPTNEVSQKPAPSKASEPTSQASTQGKENAVPLPSEPQRVKESAKSDTLPSDNALNESNSASTVAQNKSIQDIGEKIGGARKDTSVKGESRAKKSAQDGRPAWERRYQVAQIAGSLDGRDKGKWIVSDSRDLNAFKHPRTLGKFDTEQQARDAIPLFAVARNHRSVDVGGGKFEIWRDINDRKRVKVVNQDFDSREEAMQYMAEHAAEIIETNTTFGEADLPTPPNKQRVGAERRTGNVEGQNFKDTFGFRGVEFGNWNSQEERQIIMNEAFDGLLDLADALNIHPKAISLNGDLALAFGARGHGLQGARAHYEPDRAVINLTKMKGAGALAHEWFHALDHYFGRQDGKASSEWVVQKDGTRVLKANDNFEKDAASVGFTYKDSGVREEVRKAYKNMMETMFTKAEKYVEDTAKVDQFVGVARSEVEKSLANLRRNLAEKAPDFYKRNNKPASAEQLAEFDAIARQIIDGVAVETEWRKAGESKSRSMLSGYRWTNDALEKLSLINKAVRGRTGFTSERSGVLDSLRNDMQRYSSRLKMLADAQNGDEKTKNIPTDFAMDAKSLDQGRGGNYWTTPPEMAARAFQGYVEDKIGESGGRSPFLNYAPENVAIETPWGWKRPYPHGQERKAINAAIDRFINILETRETDKGVALYKRDSTPTPIDSAALKQTVASLRKAYPQATIREHESDQSPTVPKPLRDDIANSGAQGDVAGAYKDGVVHVFRSGIRDQAHAEKTIVHELTHRGLARMFGLGIKQPMLGIYASNADIATEADRIAKQYGYDRATAVEEALADLGGDMVSVNGFDKLVAYVRAALRKLGLVSQWSDNDVALLVQRAREKNKGGVTGSTKFAPAWHGSPHDFDRFSLDKIGTGEGAQAYGHGLYFAGRKEVADYYRKTLSEGRVLLNGEPADGATDRGAAARLIADGLAGGKTFDVAREDIAKQYAKYRDAAAKDADGLAKRVGEPPAPGWGTLTITDEDVQQQRDRAKYYADKLAALNTLKEGEVSVEKGRLYSVELAPAEDEYLLWDKPLSEQSEKVKAALSKEAASYRAMKRERDARIEAVGFEEASKDKTNESKYGVLGTAAKGWMKYLPSDIDGMDLYKTMQGAVGDKAASDYLHSIGIRGIKYLDGSSRSHGDGNYNYVIFNDADVSITAKYSRSAQAFARATDSAAFQKSGEILSDLFTTHGTFGALKGLKTQYHKATLNPMFKAFWERANAMAMDSARSMSRPADLASRILPKFDPRNMGDAAKALFAGRSDVLPGDLKAVSRALSDGTLDGGPSPLSGRIWTRADLITPKGQYVPGSGSEGTPRMGMGLTEKQADLYEEARAAVDASLDELAAATSWKLASQHLNPALRQWISEDPQAAPALLNGSMETRIADAKRALQELDGKELESAQKALDAMQEDAKAINEIFDKAEALKQAGYMPLMRFGKYRVAVTMRENGKETATYVSRHESNFEANQARRELEKKFSGKEFTVGPVSIENENAWKMFKGVNPETVMLFAEEAGIKADDIMQQWYREAVSSRSALKRMIERTGVAGYSEDLPRVLASFITSNGKQAGYAYHLGDMQEMLQNKDMPGDVQEEAQSLLETIQEPTEAGSKMRGLMAMWYLLGSIGSALVNSTQTVTMSIPWLSQFGAKGFSATEAASAMGKAYKIVVNPITMPADLKAAMKRAEQNGTVDSNEVFHLYAESMKPMISKLGSGNRAYRARAFMTLWGAPFAMVETLNRRATFAAAYSMAKAQGKSEGDAAKFAERAVIETQGIYAKHNRPNWSRGAIGAATLTFKQFSIAYVEMLSRMAKNGPEGKKAALLTLGILMALSGASGLPGEDDLLDVIDTFSQIFFDKPTLSRMEIRNFLHDNLGKELGGFVNSGVSNFLPVDVSSRLGLGNLIPGTGLFKPSEKDKTGELLEIFAGVQGGFVRSMVDSVRMIAEGNVSGAIKSAAPKAIQDVAKGVEMLATGEARDRAGRKVVDASPADSIWQMIGLNPNVKAEAGKKAWDVTEYMGYVKNVESGIVGRWARGIVDSDMEAIGEAKKELAEWNLSNPDAPIGIYRTQIMQRVQALLMERAGRIEKMAPREMRGMVRELMEED